MPDTSSDPQAILLLCFVLLPAIVAMIGVVKLMRVQKFRSTRIEVIGTVVSVRSVDPANSSARCRPSFEVDAPDGTRHRVEAANDCTAADHPLNSRHALWVEAQEPASAYPARQGSLSIALICIVIGGAAALIGMYALGADPTL